MRRRLLTLVILILISNPVIFSQNNPNTYQSDTSHVNSLIESAGKILYVYPDSVRKYLDTIGDISKKIEYEYGIYKYYNLSGIVYGILQEQKKAIDSYRKGLQSIDSDNFPRRRAIFLSNIGLEYWRMYQLDSAAYYYDSTIRYSEKHGIIDLVHKSLFDLGNIYLDKQNYVAAAKNYFSAREGLTKDSDSIVLTVLYGSIGVLYTQVGNFDLALENYQYAIEYDKLVDRVNNLSNTYNNIGQLYFNNRLYDSAIHYYKLSVKYALPHTKRDIEMVTNVNKGNVFIERNLYDSAYYYYNLAYSDSLLHYYPDRMTAVLINLGVYYNFKKDYKNAKKFLNRGILMADSLSLHSYKVIGLQKLYQIDSIFSDNEALMKNLREYYRTVDSVNFSSDRQKIASLEFEKYLVQQKYDNELLITENKLKNKLISNQKILLWVFIFAIAFMIIAIVLLFNGRRRRNILLEQLSEKNKELINANEELITTNEILHNQREELNHLNLTKDKFFRIIGHDLKSPFNVLLGLLQLMDEEWDQIDDSEKRKHIHALYGSSKNTYKLLEDILTWGRSQQGLLEYKPDSFRIVPHLEEIRNLFKAQLANKEIDLVIDITNDFEVHTDIRYFIHIIQNLLNNAIKFSHRGGEVTISAKAKGKEKIICVTDNGIGIPENKLEKIFDLDSDFGRLGTEKEESTGMGLILCKEYADLIGAHFNVESIEQNLEENKTGMSSFCLILNK